MRVNAIPDPDRSYAINIGNDNWWLISYLFVWICFTLFQGAFLIQFVAPLIISVLVHDVWVLATIRGRRLKLLNTADFPLVHDLVQKVSKEIKGVSIEYILWCPTDYKLSARVFHAVGRSRLYLSAAACVAGENNPASIKAIIAHELAHVANKDYYAKILVVGIFFNIISLLIFLVVLPIQPPEYEDIFYIYTGLPKPEFQRVTLKDLGLALLAIFVFINLLRRREYMADAVVGSTYVDGNIQLKGILRSVHRRRFSLFHPSPFKRATALETGSPVLRPSRLLLILSVPFVIYIVSGLAAMLEYVFVFGLEEAEYSVEDYIEAVSVVAATIPIMITAFREIRKDGSKKIPFCNTGYRIGE